MPTIKSGLDDLILANGVRPPLIGRIRAITHDQKHFAFRRKFRPLDILQLVFLTCFTFSTEETLLTLVGGPLWWFFGFVLGLVLGFCLVFGVGGFGLLPPSICSVSFPSTMTWARRPHGVRTRGKNSNNTHAMFATKMLLVKCSMCTQYMHHILYRDTFDGVGSRW